MSSSRAQAPLQTALQARVLRRQARRKDAAAPDVSAGPRRGRSRQTVFWAILLLPLACVVFLAVSFVVDVVRLRTIRVEAIAALLDVYLATKQPHTFPPPDGFFELKEQHRHIFLFGESSVVISDKLTMGQYLEQTLSAPATLVTRRRDDLRVVNFGVSGIDSHSIKARVEQAFQYTKVKPALLLLYFGHNDFNIGYKYVVNGPDAPFGNLFNPFLRMTYLLSGGQFDFRDQFPVFGTARYNFFWYGMYHRPRVFDFVQRLGLWTVDNEAYRALDLKMLEKFKTNTEGILALARSHGVPVVLVTPVCNLSAQPYGAIDVVEKTFRAGLAEKDRQKSLDLLTMAKDEERFTGDTRAKSMLLDYLRTLDDGRTTFVLDLEHDLRGSDFAFDETNFLDYFHFNDHGHRIVGEYLTAWMRENSRLRAALAL
jgi:lysophospholipase L1-like esterase